MRAIRRFLLLWMRRSAHNVFACEMVAIFRYHEKGTLAYEANNFWLCWHSFQFRVAEEILRGLAK